MACTTCSIVPPYLLNAIAEAHQGEPAGEAAARTLASVGRIHHGRRQRFEANLRERHLGQGSGRAGQSIVPPYLLEQIASADDVDDATKESVRNTLATSQGAHDARAVAADTSVLPAPTAPLPVTRGVYNMNSRGGDNDPAGDNLLPGDVLRVEGQPPSADGAANEAYDNCGKVLEFYQKIFNYNSVDGHGQALISSVHYGNKYGNALWDTDNQEMLYGDGDGRVLFNFTACLDVIGHEMTHAITEKNSSLKYEYESGALNEHLSDAFGIMVRQYAENKKARESDWLVGEMCLYPDINGVALRNMKFPGTAFNDAAKLRSMFKDGKDPQPANFKEMQAYKAANPSWNINDRWHDNGGVHIFSGIPNRAFVLCAEAFDGYTWEKAGKIWWVTQTTHRIPPTCTFIQFADATVDVAHELFGVDAAKIVRNAWNEVGIVRTV